MKKRLTLLLSSLLVVAALCASVLAVPMVAYADGATVVSVESPTEEFLYFGDIIDSKATVKLSDETEEERSIIWDNLNANEVNNLFSMAEAVGKVEGTNQSVSRRFFTLPRGLVYFVNCGALTNQEDAGYNDVYYALNEAIINNYEAPTESKKLLNEIPDRMISDNDGYSGWGYTQYNASYKSSSKHMPTKAGDPMPPAFPYNTIRATDSGDLNFGIEYTLGGLTNGTAYRVYVGTRSHWHARTVTPVINGTAYPRFEISAMAKVTVYDDITPNGGAIKLAIQGANTDEGNCAFIAVQTMEEANKMAKAAPAQVTIGGNLEMAAPGEDTTFTVGNIAAGTKVQVSLAEPPYNILFEAIAEEDGDFEITIPEERLDGIFSLYLTAVNTFGASTPTQVYITDITDFTVKTDSTGYTADDLAITVKAHSDSGIMRMVVMHNYIPTTYDESVDPQFGLQDVESTVYVKENGLYTITLYSGNNAFVSQDVVVTTIDKEDVYLSVDMALTGFTGSKPRLAFTYVAAAPAASYIVYDANGEKKSSGNGAMGNMELDYGRYVFSVTSESGKVATASAIISEKPLYFTVSGKSENGGATYTFAGANGKTIASIAAFSVNGDGVASRLMSSTSSASNFTSNPVYVRVAYTDGTVEFNKLNVTIATAKKKGCGSAVEAASLVLALGALALCAVVVLAKKKAKAN